MGLRSVNLRVGERERLEEAAEREAREVWEEGTGEGDMERWVEASDADESRG